MHFKVKSCTLKWHERNLEKNLLSVPLTLFFLQNLLQAKIY